jgi:hypothetical protein
MHRSGTSYLANTLHHLGAELPRLLMPPAADNPKGFYEPVEIAEYQQGLLELLGMSWDAIEPLRKSWFYSRQARRAAEVICDLVTSSYEAKSAIVVKDPRSALLIPLWGKVATKLNLELECFIPLRHPLDVANSLAKRNSIPRDKALCIWLNYYYTAELATRSVPRTFICFPDWCLNIEENIKKMEADLRCSFPNKNSSALQKISDDFEHSLVSHAITDGDDKNSAIVKYAEDTFALAKQLADSDESGPCRALIDLQRKRFRRNAFGLLSTDKKRFSDFNVIGYLCNLIQQSSTRG